MNLNECDFCTANSPYLYPINDGLWAVCKVCMDIHYGILPRLDQEKSSAQLRNRTAPLECSRESPDCRPGDCYCSPILNDEISGEEE